MVMDKRRTQTGFTLVELLVVIVVIAILATVVSLGLGRYLEDGRDSQRASNIAVISEALEKYYDKNGEYPGCSVLTADSNVVAGTVLPGLDQSALLTPLASDTTLNSLSCSTAPTQSQDVYQYVGDGSATCNTGAVCLSYTLRYREESSKQIIEVKSRRSASIATSGVPTLAAQGASLNSLSASWNSVPSSTGYQLQVSTTADFDNVVASQNITTLSLTVNGLDYDTFYFVRVRAVTGGAQGGWSNTVNTSTFGLGAPTLTITPSTSSQANASWTPISGSTGYTIQWSKNQTTWSSGTSTAASRAVTGLDPATLYYYRVRADINTDSGPWSAVVSSYTNPGFPTAVSMTAAMSGNNAVGTASATCANGTLQFQTRTRNTNTATAGTWSAWTAWATSGVNTVTATAQGFQYGFQTQARCLLGSSPSTTSSVSNIATTVRNFTAPGAPSVGVSTSGAVTTFTRTSTPTCSGNGVTGYQYKRTIDNGSSYAFAGVSGTAVATTTSTQGYQYGIEWQARCTNTYATGPWGGSGSNSYIRPVSPAASQTFNGYRGAWNIMYLEVNSSCASGASIVGAVDVHTWDWAWTPGNYYGWRRSTPLGWVVNEGWRNNYTQTGATTSNAAGIPSGSRWNVGGFYRCQNPQTGRSSGANVWQESGIYQAS